MEMFDLIILAEQELEMRGIKAVEHKSGIFVKTGLTITLLKMILYKYLWYSLCHHQKSLEERFVSCRLLRFVTTGVREFLTPANIIMENVL